ncbi:MAG TPA: hypothetical protein VMH32_23845 [Burkholderiales bacterium]|nr:hypothetical protein [Burkholderiales bacterium]
MDSRLTTLSLRMLLAAALTGLSCAASAHELTMEECREGSEFIKHAAMSRDNGITRDDFMGRMQADIAAIQQFPPQLRWFVQDEDDAALLTRAAERVFDTPRDPEVHESDFLQACTTHVASSSAQAPAPPAPDADAQLLPTTTADR